MKWRTPHRNLLPNACARHARALCYGAAGLWLAGTFLAGAQTTNWIAYNDHTPGTTAGWETAPNTTTYNMRGISGGNAGTVLSGNLKDFVSGNFVAAVFTSTAQGTPNDFGSSGYPNSGTPAYDLFNGKVDLGNSQSMIGLRATSATPASQQILTFSNLDPSKRYVLKGTAVRGNNYAGRWTLVTIEGADGFTDDHSAEVYTSGNFPSGGLTAGQAGFHSGENRANGAVVGWKEIAPGADGTFSVRSEQWTVNPLPNGSAPDLANYGYGLCGIMVAEVETGPPQAPQITVEPINVTTNEGAVARLSVAATGSGTLTYQWYRNGTAIAAPAGTSSSLVVTNMNGSSIYPWSSPSDSGAYQVVVSGAANPPATSTVAQVTINADTVAPSFLWALADTNSLGDLVVRIALSERVANPMTQLTEPLYWNVLKVSGPGADLGSPADAASIIVMTNVAFANTNTLEIQLVYPGAALDTATSYKVSFDSASEGPLFDRAETPNNMAVHDVPIHSHVVEVVPFNHVWKYSDLDMPPVGNWWESNYDDSDVAFWKSGPGVFDTKNTGCRTTALHNLGPVGTCLVYSNANMPANTTNYYFRTHFTFNGQPQPTGMLLLNGKFDDGAVVFLNGVELERVGINATNILAHSMYSTRSVGDGDARDVSYLFPGSLLHAGDNVLAVQLSQINGTSSDATMGLSVQVITTTPLEAPVSQPHLTVSVNGTQVSVSWAPPGGSLIEGPSVNGPWTTNAAASNPHVFTPPAGAGQKFFRVVQ